MNGTFRKIYAVLLCYFILTVSALALNISDSADILRNVAYDTTLTQPSLENRVYIHGDTATLFAPYTNKDFGWYDANKTYSKHPDTDDGLLCWAASCSNMITWYLDGLRRQGKDVSAYDTDLNTVFGHFKKNFIDEGYDPIIGFSWYFTGKLPMGDQKPPELDIYPSGGYLSDLPYCADGWYMLDIQTQLYYGHYGEKVPFLHNLTGSYYEDSPLYNHRSFSENILQQLLYGPTSLTVRRAGSSPVGSHAVTLWGCDFNIHTGLINKIYMTDSSDMEEFAAYPALKPVGIKPRNPDKGGIRMTGYFLDNDFFEDIVDSLLLFSPGCVEKHPAEKVIRPEILTNTNILTPQNDCIFYGTQENGLAKSWVLSSKDDQGMVLSYTDTQGQTETKRLENKDIAYLHGSYFDKSRASIGTFSDVKGYSGHGFKVALRDPARSGFTATASLSQDGLHIRYHMASVGKNEYISAFLKDVDGRFTHYGKLKQVDTSDGSFTLPYTDAGVLQGKTLVLFNEKADGGLFADTVFSSSVSPFIDIPLTGSAYLTATKTDFNGKDTVISIDVSSKVQKGANMLVAVYAPKSTKLQELLRIPHTGKPSYRITVKGDVRQNLLKVFVFHPLKALRPMGLAEQVLPTK